MKSFSEFRNRKPLDEGLSLLGKNVILGGRKGRVVRAGERTGVPAESVFYQVKFDDGTMLNLPAKEILQWMTEEDIAEVSPPGFKGTVKAMKKHKDIDNPYALAWWMKNKGYKSNYDEDGVKKESIDESVWRTPEERHQTYHDMALDLIAQIQGVDAPRKAVSDGKWIDSFGDKVGAKINLDLDADEPGTVEYQQNRGRGDWSFVIDTLKGDVKYTHKRKSGKFKNTVDFGKYIRSVKESVDLDEYRRQDVYVIVDKKGKVVAANLTKKNAHKEISRHRDATIVLDPDAKVGDTLKYFAKESVELGEGKFDYDPRIKKMSKKGKEILAHMTNSYETATHDDWIDHNNVHTLPKSVVQKTLTMASKERNLPAKQKKELALIKKELGESVELDEDNTAAVARQVKKAVKKYVTGTPRVQSKGGKVRFIMLRADKIDNELRKMILNIEHPKANVKNMDDIHYANISDRIISAGVDVWIDALNLKV
jgi:hypothetical protein